jgi:ATP-binding cassette subfamily B protein
MLSTILWALRLTWATNPRLTAGVVLTALLRNLLPAALVLIVKSLVNAISAALESGEQMIGAILPILILGLAISLVEVLSRNLSLYFDDRLRDELDIRVSARILEHAATLDLAYFEDPEFQDVMARARQNTAGHFSQFITRVIDAAANSIQIASLAAILVFIEPFITVIFLLFGLPYLFFHWRLADLRYQTEYLRTTHRRWSSYYLSQVLDRNAVPETRLLNLAPLFIRKFRSLMDGFRDQNRQIYRKGLGARSLFSVITTLAFYTACAWVAYQTLQGALTIGDVVIFAAVAVRLPKTIEFVVIAMTNALEHALYISNMMKLLGIKPGIVDGPTPLEVSGPAQIEIRNLSFTYPGSEQKALDDVNITVRAGESLALVGENGAGKSTLVKLITRFYDPDSGCILLNGTDIREVPVKQLHASIAFVFQNFRRFEARASENIAFGNWEELLDQPGEVERLAKLAGVDRIITALPDGYDTLLGRVFGEHTLSEGQWQKLAIARALARRASLLILDEPSSSLDARAEYELFSRFRDISAGQTSILISHRFSTVSIADRIVVMDNGRIIESGTHPELIARSGHYASLYELHQRNLAAPQPPHS